MSRPIQEKRSIQKKTSIAGVSTSYNIIGTSLTLLRVLSGVMQRIKHCCFNRCWCEFSIEPYLLDSWNTSLCSHTSNSRVWRLENYWGEFSIEPYLSNSSNSPLCSCVPFSGMKRSENAKQNKVNTQKTRQFRVNYKFVILWLYVIVLIEKCFICSQIDSLKNTNFIAASKLVTSPPTVSYILILPCSINTYIHFVQLYNTYKYVHVTYRGSHRDCK